MASELRVNQITSITGVGTVTFDAGGVTFSGSPNLGNAAITSINSGPISGTRNKILNGEMRLDQRNAGGSVTPTDSQYTLDRYQCWLSQSSKLSVQRSSTVPVGFTNSILITSLSALSVGSNDEHGITQKIEGYNISDLNWGATDAKPITLSFWVRSSLSGSFGGMIGNGSLSRIYPFSYTINSPNNWEYKTITIPGETTGTWTKDETWGMAVHFQFGVGSNRTGSAGSWISGNTNIRGVNGQTNLLATNGATWNMTGLQLELGSVSTPFERRSYGLELSLCQRYFEQIDFAQRYAGYSGYLTAFSLLNFPFKQTKRTTSYTVYVSSSPGATWSSRTNTFVFYSPTPDRKSTRLNSSHSSVSRMPSSA